MLPPEEAWVIATNKSFGLMGGSKLRAFGDLVLGQRRPPEAAADRNDQVGGEHECGTWCRRPRRRSPSG